MKYVIELNEHQMRLLSWACDTIPRLVEGQDWSYRQLLEEAWEKRCKKATGEPMDDEWDGGWSAMRDEAEELCKKIKARFWGLPANTMNGIHYDETADILWDIYQVCRHQLWKDNPNPSKSKWTVDAFPASQVGSEPLVKVYRKEEEE